MQLWRHHTHPSKGWNFSDTQKPWQLRSDSPDKYCDSLKPYKNHLISSVLAAPVRVLRCQKNLPHYMTDTKSELLDLVKFPILSTKRKLEATHWGRRGIPQLCHQSHMLQSCKSTWQFLSWRMNHQVTAPEQRTSSRLPGALTTTRVRKTFVLQPLNCLSTDGVQSMYHPLWNMAMKSSSLRTGIRRNLLGMKEQKFFISLSTYVSLKEQGAI